MDIFTLLAISVALSMDAFSVSICKGLATKKFSLKTALLCGLWFGGFQALMPLIGYFLGTQFEYFITNIDHWIAFGLLLIIGVNMIREALGEDEATSRDASNASFGEDETTSRDASNASFGKGKTTSRDASNASVHGQQSVSECACTGFKTMLGLAIATSIDALAVGVTFAFLKVNIWFSVMIIGVITFVFSFVGVKIGNIFGSRYSKTAEIVGGVILIVLGIKILVEHLFF